MIERAHTPLLLVISAPSGAGKTTLCQTLVGEFEQVTYSVSCTTRPPRPSEVHGKSYYFMSEDQFMGHVEAGEFLEYARVYNAYYGTLKQTVLDGFAKGRDVLMDLDVQGAAKIRQRVAALAPDDPLRRGFLDIFIAPPSMKVLEERLRGRGQDADDVIDLRLSQARDEVQRWHEYRYMIINDRLDHAYAALRSIVIAEHVRVR
jgi:guanylate kinase